jgi:hypothetical protein
MALQAVQQTYQELNDVQILLPQQYPATGTAGGPTLHEAKVLKELARAASHTVGRIDAADSAAPTEYAGLVLEHLRDQRCQLVLELARLMLMRNVPSKEILQTLSRAAERTIPHANRDTIWLEVDLAENCLRDAMREALCDGCVSAPVKEVLGIHYLRLEMNRRELARLVEDMPINPQIVLPERGYGLRS